MDKVTVFQCNAYVAHDVVPGFVFLSESNKTACRDIFHRTHNQFFSLSNLLIGVPAEYHTVKPPHQRHKTGTIHAIGARSAP